MLIDNQITAIMIDSREPKNIQQLWFGDVPVVVTELPCGDVWASCVDGELLVIERKTPPDLLGSIGDNRLFTQVAKMRERSQWAYVLISGTLLPSHDGKTLVNGRSTGWNWDSVQGALLSIQEMGVSIVYAQHDNHLVDAVMRLARRSRAQDRVLPATNGHRVMTHAERVLTSLPGIGLERAQAILTEYEGRAGHALAWLTWLSTFHEVAGIGDGIKTNVRFALGLEPDEELCVMTPTTYINDTLAREAQKEQVLA